MILFLTGCENQVGGDAFFNHLDEFENGLDQQDWDELSIQTNKLKEMYEKNKLKLQLNGDEGEYEELYKSISKLIATDKEEDTLSTRIEIATTSSLLEGIYSL